MKAFKKFSPIIKRAFTTVTKFTECNIENIKMFSFNLFLSN